MADGKTTMVHKWTPCGEHTRLTGRSLVLALQQLTAPSITEPRALPTVPYPEPRSHSHPAQVAIVSDKMAALCLLAPDNGADDNLSLSNGETVAVVSVAISFQAVLVGARVDIYQLCGTSGQRMTEADGRRPEPAGHKTASSGPYRRRPH